MFTNKKAFNMHIRTIAFSIFAFALILTVGCKKSDSVISDDIQPELTTEITTANDTTGTTEPVLALGVLDCPGTVSATFSGVQARQNCPVGSASVYGYNYETGVNTGYKWQCVEYVNRYYYKVYGMNLLNTAIYGNAKNYYEYGNHAALGLAKYANAGSVAPQTGDILVSTYGTYGHVAIVTSVSATLVGIIDQNFSSTSARTLTRSGNTVGAFGSGYTVAGWVRKAAAVTPPPTPALSSPAANATNLTGNVNFSWTCPNATEYRIQIIESTYFTGFNATTGFVTSTGAASTNCAYNQNVGNQTSFVWTNAQAGKTYYWAVRANNSGGASSFTAYRTFTTQKPCILTLSTASYSIAATALANGLATSVTSSASSWTVTSGASWISVRQLTTGFVISCTANTATVSRTGTITVKNGCTTKTVTITQAKK